MKHVARHFLGSNNARQTHKKQRKLYENFSNAYEYLVSQSVQKPLTEFRSSRPIFVFSAGWRCGSTLLQRLLCSDSNTFLWGEPFDHSGLIQKLSAMLSPIDEEWPPSSYFFEKKKYKNMSTSWIANTYPKLENLLAAHEKFLETLFLSPLNEVDVTTWGIKEVRLGYKEALYLKLMFPNAKFIYLTRNLHDSYSSYKNFTGGRMNWYSNWPKRVFTPYSYAKHYYKMKLDFANALPHTGGILIDYSNLRPGDSVINELANYCSLELDQNVLKKVVGSGSPKVNCNLGWRLSKSEKLLLTLGRIKL